MSKWQQPHNQNKEEKRQDKKKETFPCYSAGQNTDFFISGFITYKISVTPSLCITRMHTTMIGNFEKGKKAAAGGLQSCREVKRVIAYGGPIRRSSNRPCWLTIFVATYSSHAQASEKRPQNLDHCKMDHE